MAIYNDASRRLQDRFDTRRLADRVDERLVRDTIDVDDRAFIERARHVLPRHRRRRRPAAVLVQGRRARASSASSTSARSRSRTTTATACTSRRATRSRTPTSGCSSSTSSGAAAAPQRHASIDADDPLLADLPGGAARRARARAQVFPNCPRYIHKYASSSGRGSSRGRSAGRRFPRGSGASGRTTCCRRRPGERPGGRGRPIKADDGVVRFYDAFAGDYDLAYGGAWDAAVERHGAALDALIRDALDDAGDVLDCSCGIGTQAIGLARRGYRVTGTDISPGAIERARREARRSARAPAST